MPYAEAFTRFGVGAAFAVLTGAVFVLARRRRPRSAWTFLWVAPFLLTVWSGWSTTSWGERYEYELQCREWWNDGTPTYGPGVATTATTSPPPADRATRTAPAPANMSVAEFMGGCIDEQRAHAERRRADPDSSCNWEERSGCPGSDYRALWLGTSFIAGGAGLLVSVRPVLGSAPPRS